MNGRALADFTGRRARVGLVYWLAGIGQNNGAVGGLGKLIIYSVRIVGHVVTSYSGRENLGRCARPEWGFFDLVLCMLVVRVLCASFSLERACCILFLLPERIRSNIKRRTAFGLVPVGVQKSGLGWMVGCKIRGRGGLP